VGRPPHRLATLVLALVTAAGNLAPCAGWRTTPEARMACCTDDAACPMHKDGAGAASRPLTQAAADSCCASPVGDDAAPTAAYVLSAIVDLAPVAPPARHSAIWPLASARFDQPPPPRAVPRHLLLSVLLV
jgi:hypothetical protein